MAFEPELYVLSHRSLYTYFGWIGGSAELLAIAVTLVLAWRLRHDRSSFLFVTAAAVLLLAALVAFMVIVLPTNLTMRQWPLDSIPDGWTRLRDRWEYTHAARALLVLGALSALVVSVMRGAPAVNRPATAGTAASPPA